MRPSQAPKANLGSYRPRLEKELRKVQMVGFGGQIQIDLPIRKLSAPPILCREPSRRLDHAGIKRALPAAESTSVLD